MKEDEVKPGQIYRHFKCGLYTVITLARKEDTKETLVIYIDSDNGKIWARTLDNWLSEAVFPSGSVPRFQRIK